MWGDLAALLIVRAWLFFATGWGLLVMWRLYRRGQQLDFPIVPPALVKLTAAFLFACLATVTWVTIRLFFLGEAWDHEPIGMLSPWERTAYGTSLVYALSCSLWIINTGLKGYRHGPKVDTGVLEAIVSGMHDNPEIRPVEEEE